MEEVAGTQCLVCEDFLEEAQLRLFCFPGRGNDVAEFKGWANALAADHVEVFCVQIPKRVSRRAPAPLEGATAAAATAADPASAAARAVLDVLVTDLLTHMDKPFLFLGTSPLGAQLAHALVLELEERGLPRPRRLVVYGAPPPPLAEKALAPVAATDKDGLLISSLRPLVMSLAPEAGMITPRKTSCPVTAFGGPVAAAELRAWGSFTEGGFSFSLSPGGGEGVEGVLADGPAGDIEAALLAGVQGVVSKEVNLSRTESAEMIQKWNSGRGDYPDTLRLHDMFRASAAKNPDKTAIVYEGSSLTFREVDELTDRLADWLYANGTRVDSPVGIYMERCDEFALCYIAAHKATGAYMPLEIVYPAELLKNVLEKAKPPAVLTKAKYASQLPSWQTHLCMDKGGSWIAEVRAAQPIPMDAIQPTPDSLAYVVMSSGTTGAPKGICCPHRGAVHSYDYRLQRYPYEEGEKEACGVFFVWEMLRPLLGGKPLLVIPDDVLYDPERLVKFIGDNGVTRTLFTPSLFQLVLDTVPEADLKKGLGGMKIIWLCGEVVTVELYTRFHAMLPNVRVENLYSISECHDVSYCSLSMLDRAETPKYAPCGKVVTNVRAYVLDDSLRPVPVGVPGRLFVAGPVLARGYLGMPGKTAERFPPDPFGEPGSRMYDTGDRGRYLPSGRLEVVGRCDFMVKVRGYSVVVGAVEAALAEHPAVSTACVLTEGEEGSMDKRLVAYVVPAAWESPPRVGALRRFLRDRLPPYSVPSVFILVGKIPINAASGKTNRKGLPTSNSPGVKMAPDDDDDNEPSTEGVSSPGGSGGAASNPEFTDFAATTSASDLSSDEEASAAATAAAAAAAPTGNPSSMMTPTERELAGVWAGLLGVGQALVRRDSDFFDLGGHSLLLVRLASGVKEAFGEAAAVTVAEVIQRPRLADLAAHIDGLLPPRTSSSSSPHSSSSSSSSSSPSSSPSSSSPHVPFSTATEHTLAGVWAGLLGIGEALVRPGSDFFDLGGHSLLLVRLTAGIKQAFGEAAAIPISDVLQRPRLSDLARLIDEELGSGPLPPAAEGTTTAAAAATPVLESVVSSSGGVDLVAEAGQLDPSIFPAATRKAGYSRFRAGDAVRPPGRVLLTGATGFLGAHILAALLRSHTPDRVYCLVRCKDQEDGEARVAAGLRRYGLWQGLEDHMDPMEGVVVVPGDLSQPLLGLTNSHFQVLAGELDAIIHNGAAVNLVRSYPALKSVNVLGTQEVLRLAVTNGMGTNVKPVHYVSTNAVFPFSPEAEEFAEDADMGEKWQELNDGYAQSKWVAERMCMAARARGLPVGILRPGNMSPSSSTGAWNESDFIHILLQGCLEVGSAPSGVAWLVDMTPVDFAARAMVHVAVEQPRKSLGQVMHLQNPQKPLDFALVVEWLEEAAGVSLARLSLDNFRAKIDSKLAELPEGQASALPQLVAGLDSFAYYLSGGGTLGCGNLLAALDGSGVDCPPIDPSLIATYASTLTTSDTA